jgi:hypothetical protein
MATRATGSHDIHSDNARRLQGRLAVSTHLELIEEGQVLVVRFDGTLSFSDRSDALANARPLIQRHPISRILVDFSEASINRDEKPGAAGDFTTELARMPFPVGTSIAYVGAPRAAADPVEWLANAIGLRVRRFYKRDEALAWLVTLA